MNLEKFREIKNKKVLVFGDFMVDKYIIGSVNRISPEAPVPVIKVDKENYKLGGAGNVINNLISLGTNVRVLGCIGDDLAGNFIYNTFLNNNVDVMFLKKLPGIRTIQKTRIVSKKQQFIRVDDEEVKDLPDEYLEYVEKNISEILKDIDCVIISDYAKGSVSYKYTKILIDNAKKMKISIIVDPKGTNYSKYSGATLCTPNMKEFQEIVGKVDTEEDIEKLGRNLIKKLNMDYLVLTRSEDGISLITEKKKIDFPAKEKEVIDVSGAGDTVVATIAILLAIGIDIKEICSLANVSASVVISKFGTSTLTLDEFISNIEENTEFKLLNPLTAKYVVNDLKSKGKKIVFTNGCFDLFHIGHLSSFEQAKKYGDILIVAVNSDKSVKENKGDLRPIISENDRIKMICSLEMVDYVILMDDKTPEKLIDIIRPDVSIKGEDWKEKYVPEKALIESYGGKMEFIKLEKGLSTTNIIDKILKVYGKK